jgi:sulfate/thiosulfate transport system ATP-binding protein
MELRVAGIGKEFGETAALRGVSLEIRGAELLALLGPSGSGKTTLLRIIAGLEIPDRGQVFFGGEDATAIPVQTRQIGFVFQHYALFRHLTVAGNIAYGLRARSRATRPSEDDIRRRVGELLDLVQLSGLERRFPAQLSGGQRQRVALARALAVEPRVLLLDEPFGALDAKVRKDLRRWLRDVHERTGQTTVFVTHDQEEALELADRVAILNHGRLEQLGTPDEVYDSPASPFVMSFVGETSRIPVRLANGQVFYENRRLSLRPEGVADGPGDLYVRPWDLQLHAGDDADLVGTVQAMRRVGAAHRAEVAIGAGSVEVDLPAGASFPKGAPIQVQILRGCVFAKTSRDSVTGPL